MIKTFEEEVMGELDTLKTGQKTLTDGQEILLKGQADLTVAFGRIWRRVSELEADGKWKLWALRVGRALLPFAGGIAVTKWPWLSTLVADLLKAAAAP